MGPSNARHNSCLKFLGQAPGMPAGGDNRPFGESSAQARIWRGSQEPSCRPALCRDSTPAPQVWAQSPRLPPLPSSPRGSTSFPQLQQVKRLRGEAGSESSVWVSHRGSWHGVACQQGQGRGVRGRQEEKREQGGRAGRPQNVLAPRQTLGSSAGENVQRCLAQLCP